MIFFLKRYGDDMSFKQLISSTHVDKNYFLFEIFFTYRSENHQVFTADNYFLWFYCIRINFQPFKKLYNYSVIYDRFWERSRTKRISYRSVLYMWHIVKVEIGFENGLAQKYFFFWLTVTEFLYVYSPNTFYSSTWPHTIILMFMSLIGR